MNGFPQPTNSLSCNRFVFCHLFFFVFNFYSRLRPTLIHQGLQVPKCCPLGVRGLVLLEGGDNSLADAKKRFVALDYALYVFLHFSL